MTRRRRILISAGILAVCALLALGVLAMLPPGSHVTKANFDRIEIGMKMAEVEAILDKYHDFERVHDYQLFYWYDPYRARIRLRFDAKRVSDKRFTESTETIPDKLRRWMGLSPDE